MKKKINNKISINKIKKKLNIGIVGTGNMAFEYAKIIKYFNHNIFLIVGSENSRKNILIKKYKIKHNYLSFEQSVNECKKFIDAWIICTSPHKLNGYFQTAIRNKINFLIEKSILIKSSQLVKINQKLSKTMRNSFLISYNRNYYDYLPELISILKSNSINQVYLRMSDPYKKILKQKKSEKKDLVKYITSHWIALILNILKQLNIKFEQKNFLKFSNKNVQNSKTIIFEALKNKKKIPIIFSLLPDNPTNTSIYFYTNKLSIILSPIEKMKINYDLKVMKKNNQLIYLPRSKVIKVNDKFKPGFKNMYYDFIQSCVINKKNSIFGTNIQDLIKLYRVCEIFD